MRRKVSMVMAALALAGLASACDVAASKSKGKTAGPAAAGKKGTGPAKISCAQATFDFGEVVAGKKVSHVFVLKNVGGAPLTIKRTASG